MLWWRYAPGATRVRAWTASRGGGRSRSLGRENYTRRPEGDDKFTDEGWFKPGDVVTETLGSSDRDRSKDLIKSGGEWISSVELENALMAHPAVSQAAVIAIPDEKWDERPLAAIVLVEGESASEDELHAHLEADFAKFWLPDAYEFVESIPMTATGKFQKLKLREQFEGYTSTKARVKVIGAGFGRTGTPSRRSRSRSSARPRYHMSEVFATRSTRASDLRLAWTGGLEGVSGNIDGVEWRPAFLRAMERIPRQGDPERRDSDAGEKRAKHHYELSVVVPHPIYCIATR